MRPFLVCVLLLAAAPAWAATNGYRYPAPEPRRVSVLNLARAPAAPADAAIYRPAPRLAPVLQDQVRVGTRVTYSRLIDEDKETFLGNITHLDEINSLLPYKLYADWHFQPDWGVELSYDRFRARTLNRPPEPGGERTSDGSFALNELTACLMWRYRNDSDWTPYAGAGLALVPAQFDAATWWGYGYNSPEHWESVGEPRTPYKGKSRRLDPHDTIGCVVAAGCKRRLSDRWSLDFYLRYMKVDVDTRYTITLGRSVEDKGVKSIPLDHFTAGVGIEYAF